MQCHLCILILELGRYVGLSTNIPVLSLRPYPSDMAISSAISTLRAIKEQNLLTAKCSRRNVSTGQFTKYFTSMWLLKGVGYLGGSYR
jgi:hypothetical protein